MKCVICKHGHTKTGTATIVLERAGACVVFKSVPANVCDNCGEYYVSEEITRKLLERAEAAVKNGAEVEIIRFAA